jgi:hypothetical protein
MSSFQPLSDSLRKSFGFSLVHLAREPISEQPSLVSSMHSTPPALSADPKMHRLRSSDATPDLSVDSKTALSTATCSPDDPNDRGFEDDDDDRPPLGPDDDEVLTILPVDWPDIGAKDGLDFGMVGTYGPSSASSLYGNTNNAPCLFAFQPAHPSDPHHHHQSAPAVPFLSPKPANKFLMCEETFQSPIASHGRRGEAAFGTPSELIASFGTVQSSPIVDHGPGALENGMGRIREGRPSQMHQPVFDDIASEDEEEDGLDDLSHYFQIVTSKSKDGSKPDRKWLSFIVQTVNASSSEDPIRTPTASPDYGDRDLLRTPEIPSDEQFFEILALVGIDLVAWLVLTMM